MIKYIFFSFFIVLIACKVVSPEQHAINTACEQLQDSINKFWRYDSVEQHYVYHSRGLFEPLDRSGNKFKECMENDKDTTYFVKLLGKHYRVEDTPDSSLKRMVYMLTKYPCVGNFKDYHCVWFEIYFQRKAKVTKVSYLEGW